MSLTTTIRLVAAVPNPVKQAVLLAGGAAGVFSGDMFLSFAGIVLALISVWWLCLDIQRAEMNREIDRFYGRVTASKRARALAVWLERQLPAIEPASSDAAIPKCDKVELDPTENVLGLPAAS